MQGITDIHRLLNRESPLAGDDFVAGEETVQLLRDCSVLVVGAGGLGCELLKNLALSGFTNIHVIDMDTIDVSNLNRQFLFRHSDVGKPKALVAAQFIMQRIPGVTITPHHAKIQDKDDVFYSSFDLIICGLDSVEARRWMNAKVLEFATTNEQIIPMMDGGTEGFKGQSRIILPTMTACYECSLDMQSETVTYPLCTIANTPRLPEHCIQWASVLEWPRVFEEKIDTDDPQHLQWLYETAAQRAAQFNIPGVTYTLTQGVVKNIIPAIASTNAIIAASCVNEAFKLATNAARPMNNYMMYIGDTGVYTYTFDLQKKEDCPVCGHVILNIELPYEATLQHLMDALLKREDHTFSSPSLRTSSKTLYMRAPTFLEEATRPNLSKKLKDLVDDSQDISVTDPSLHGTVSIRVTYI